MYIKKKTFILIMTYLAAAVLTLGAYTALHFGIERDYRRTAAYGYAHSFEETVAAMNGLGTALRRASCATGAEMTSVVCTDIYGSCLTAQMTLAELPFSTQELEQTSAFISSAADSARSELRRCAADGLDDASRESFAELCKTAEKLAARLSELREKVYNGQVVMDRPENAFEQSGRLVSTEMLKLEDDAAPSESSLRQTSTGDAAPVTEQTARMAAAEFFGLDPEQLTLDYTAQNGVRGFGFDGGEIVVRADGEVISLSSSRAVTGNADKEKLTERAWEFLAQRGFENMHLASCKRIGGTVTFEFECTDDGVRCASDGVRLSFAGDDGKIYAYDASMHLENHVLRHSDTAAVDESAARSAIPPTLHADFVGMCYAPSGDGSLLCYEFDCTDDSGAHVHILVSAQTARQVDITVD